MSTTPITPSVSPLALAKDDIVARVIADAASPAVGELIRPLIDPEVMIKSLTSADVVAFIDDSGYLPQQCFHLEHVLAVRLWSSMQAVMSLFLAALYDYQPGFDFSALPTIIGDERLAKLFLTKSPKALVALAIKRNPLLELVATTKAEIYVYARKIQCIGLLFVALYCRMLCIVRTAGLRGADTLSPLAFLHIDVAQFLQMVAPTQLAHDISLSGYTRDEVFQRLNRTPGPDAVAVTRDVIAHLDELFLQQNPSFVVVRSNVLPVLYDASRSAPSSPSELIDMLYEGVEEDVDGIITPRLALPAPPTTDRVPPLISVYISSDDEDTSFSQRSPSVIDISSDISISDSLPDLVSISDVESIASSISLDDMEIDLDRRSDGADDSDVMVVE
ncbi:hypothetical protein FISHEDRAFT_75170 [Fistulina hepatica ATCC 64428]|uniref:Uncharacterized protein n=1 Tax=Fistulina hepatica ATCC 64428 TaxID=1128425 RepID=A0A0D7A856_9AGAR|nr:hypothetical protein FISHEDRAFT_75170 [Fistulina hepatica ATCC 64428]